MVETHSVALGCIPALGIEYRGAAVGQNIRVGFALQIFAGQAQAVALLANGEFSQEIIAGVILRIGFQRALVLHLMSVAAGVVQQAFDRADAARGGGGLAEAFVGTIVGAAPANVPIAAHLVQIIFRVFGDIGHHAAQRIGPVECRARAAQDFQAL